MVDSRFYTSSGELPISVLLDRAGLGSLWLGDSARDRVVSGVSELDTAASTDICFASSEDFADLLECSAAGVVLHAPALGDRVPASATAIPSEIGQIAFARLSRILYPEAIQAAVTGAGPAPRIEEHVLVGANAVIAPGVEIGAGSVIGANTVIGPGVTIGRNCSIGPNCTIEFSHLGNDVVVLPGARLGVSGFGYLPIDGKIVPVPQLGRTIVQDRVEIGANSVIDRGALGDTVIGEGTKIGNLVVIAHNCRIGRNCMLVGFVGLAGSVTLEDNVTMAGGGGTAGHITLGAGTVVLAAAWVSKSFPAGSRIGGAPAQDVKAWWGELAALRRIAKGRRP